MGCSESMPTQSGGHGTHKLGVDGVLLGIHPPGHVADDPVERRQVNRLDDAHVVERHVQVLLGQRPQLAAGEAGAAEGSQVVPVGPLDGPQDVGAVAGAADGDEQVAGAGQVLELLDEDALEALVVGPGEDVRACCRSG